MPTPPKTDNPLLLSGIALAMTSAVTVVLTLYVESKERFWLKRCGPVIHERQSAFSHIRVREKDHVRSLMFVRPKGGEGLQTSIDLHAPSELQLDYTRYMFASFLHRQAQDQVLIVGFDGQPEGKQAIKDGKIFADPIQFPDKMGIEVVRSIVAHSKGEHVEPEQLIPTSLYRQEDGLKDSSLQ